MYNMAICIKVEPDYVIQKLAHSAVTKIVTNQTAMERRPCKLLAVRAIASLPHHHIESAPVNFRNTL